MDMDRFDFLTKSFAASESRRGVMKLTAAGLAALGFGSVLAEDGEAARCVKPGRRCLKPNGERKKCCKGARCQGATCVCKGNKTKCRRKCVNLNNDEQNCGSCGNKCPQGSTCENGSCTSNCPDECCSSNDCPGSEICQNGSCTCTTECCTTDDCQGTEICSQNGTCICPNECCVNADCPQPGGACQPNGTCFCGQCCFNEDCAPNQNCVLVNDSRFCFCKPELVCADGQVCCPANLSCINNTCQ